MTRPAPPLEDRLVTRLYQQSNAARWGLTVDPFRAALEASVAHAFPNGTPLESELAQYVASLHLDDLALACACGAGLEPSWDYFVREYQPALYRAADAIDPSGGARDLADALHADLFGLREREGVRQSLFRYFHGRSRLTTWLRAVLSQRHVDRIRSERGHDPLPDDEAMAVGPLITSQANPDQPRLLSAIGGVLKDAVDGLAPRDRLRLRCYYSQDLTLAAIGRMLGEHEGTVSRHLTRTRRAIRDAVETGLRRDHGFDAPTIAECFRAVVDDAGSLDVTKMFGEDAGRKIDGQDRSN